MKVQVRLFARYREEAGHDRVDVELPEGGTVESAWEAVAHRFPGLRPYRPFTLFALRDDFVEPDHTLGDGDELCLFPPVSGGAGGASRGDDWIEVAAEPLDEGKVADAVADPAAGAVVLFSGVVRAETGGRRVKFLEYEAHAPMALAKMREIAAEVRRRWPDTRRMALVHRVGRLEIGESSVMIAVSGPHRREAFEACHFAINTLKETVPIWKKEHFEDGEIWVGLQSECDHRH
ncbi:MAG TPA: molybdenum cofactor biosynthesis protein MoaE [Methylomirabilota bacterium]|nr:molybdenum cofactor biosynthesis protein MoaE [Methylomirabilota bacterium]